MELSGWVAVALAVIVLGYLVPTVARRQGVAAQSRVTDRFSEGLRLVKPNSVDALAEQPHGARATVHNPEIVRRRTEALAMMRPTAPEAQRVNARELAAARAQRAAAISRRAAARRRRAVLTGAFVVLTVTLWFFVPGNLGMMWWSIPATLLTGFLGYASVRAAIQDRKSDSRARGEMMRLDQRLRLFRTEEADARPVRASFDEIVTPYEGTHARGGGVDVDAEPKHSSGTLIEDVAFDLAEEQESVVDVEDISVVASHARSQSEPLPAEGGPEWTPIPVPVPTYTLKAEAPRREVEAFESDDLFEASSPVRPTSAAPLRREQEEEPAAQMFSLEDVLARRRAI